jgi:hypothetical protein
MHNNVGAKKYLVVSIIDFGRTEAIEHHVIGEHKKEAYNGRSKIPFFLFVSRFSVIFLENQMCRLSSDKGFVTSQL